MFHKVANDHRDNIVILIYNKSVIGSSRFINRKRPSLTGNDRHNPVHFPGYSSLSICPKK